MAQRIIIGSLLSTIVFFFWGFAYWGLSPIPRLVSKAFPNETIAQDMMDNIPESGVYFYPPEPDMNSEASIAEHRKKHLAGPVMQLFFVRDAGEPMPPSVFVYGILHNFVTSLLAAVVLTIAAPVLPTYGKRVGFVTLLGVLAAVWIVTADGIWWRHSWDWCGVIALYNVVSGLLMGLVLGAIVLRKKEG